MPGVNKKTMENIMKFKDGSGRAPPSETKAHTETLKPTPIELKSFKLNGAFYVIT